MRRAKNRKGNTLVEFLLITACIVILTIPFILVITNCTNTQKYLVIDNTTKQEWVSIGYPQLTHSGNVRFNTSSGEGVIIHGSVTIKKINDE